MIKRINLQAFLEFICFLFFALLIFYLTVSGRYLSYVTPKMAPFLYFASAVMLIWAVSKIPGLFLPQHRVRAAHCLVLIIPILLLLSPHSQVNASGMSAGYLGGGLTGATGGVSSTGAKVDRTQGNAAGNSAPADGSAADKQEDDSIVKQYGLALSEDGSIQVSDKLFYPWITEIFTNMNKYEGVEITIKGFVFKDAETMATNEFVPARLLMWCCSADLSPCGIVCEYDKASELKEDAWVTVTGVIHIGQYQGQDEPQITVTSVSPADKPKEEYVYPW